MASETDKRLANLHAELEKWRRKGEAAADALADLPDDADESELANAREWLAHCEQKHAAIARVIDELENSPDMVARLDDYRKR